MNFVKKIDDKRKETVILIRQFIKSQKKLWQKIPYLALQADGRGGFSEHYNRAYTIGYWGIHTVIGLVYIDCANGRLVTFTLDRPRKVMDHVVESIHSSSVDAQQIINRLTSEQIQQNSRIEYFNGSHKTPELWRKAIDRNYGVYKNYRRKRRIRTKLKKAA